MASTLQLNLDGFEYEDVYRASQLPLLDARFDAWLAGRDGALRSRYRDYRNGGEWVGPDESSLLIAVACELEDFLVAAFGVGPSRDGLRAAQERDAVVHAFKREFVKRRIRKQRTQPTRDFAELDPLIPARPDADREWSVARFWADASEGGNAAQLALLEEWLHAACHSEAGRAATSGWVSLALPQATDYFKLVPIMAVPGEDAGRVEGAAAPRRRDGFDLTDGRPGLRETMNQVHYCVYCHDHSGDVCSHGFPAKEGAGFRANPLDVSLSGCPLEERISEAHTLKRDGFTLGALAMIMLDNPLLPATGHRICNDCMKSCIYQKQDPVNIPEIETRILTDVLEWRWGFELYFLLTQWNPLNRARPYRLPYNGRNTLCVGAGPAGFNLSHHLLQEGFGVVIVDGLKIEPLPSELFDASGRPTQPVEDVKDLYQPLDARTNSGFGGVAEYGITVRWDKNFLTLIRLVLERQPALRVYGGIRLGGTIMLEDVPALGFDHVTLATGAGRPTVLPVRNNMARGMRQASDFLMALQLTGAAKRDSLANLQVRLPAVVIGGGLTSIDTATEVQAYYIRQVEKVLARWEAVGETRAGLFDAYERGVLEEFLAHGRAVRAERVRAHVAGELPDFTPLIRAWGGVTVVYRRAMAESPAYLRNHEEIIKALEEGIYYAEALEPTEAVLDEHGHVQQLRCVHTESDEAVTLPARAVLVAAGSIPNTVYEREHPGTFEMDGKYFAAYRIDDAGEMVRVATTGHCKGAQPGFFTSYRAGDLRVSFVGDNHPWYHGSVVKAMASSKHAARDITALLGRDSQQAAVPDQGAFDAFAASLDVALCPEVVAVERLAPHLTSLTVRAPQATRHWLPGQVYRLQNFERHAEHVAGQMLAMEGMAIDGVHVDKARGEVQLLINSVGVSSRIAASLKPGTRVILMGPTGTGLPVPENSTVTVAGGHSAVTSTVDGAAMWRAAGNRIVFIGHFRNVERARAVQRVIEILTDQAIWVLDEGPALSLRRQQDACFVHGLDEFLQSCTEMEAPFADWVRQTDQFIVSDHPESMETFRRMLRAELKPALKPGFNAIAAVNSPMQCMMKEVCAQCLCRHVDSTTGEPSRFVFSCFNQHQPLFELDFANLQARQGQNSVQEKISNAWLGYLMDGGPGGIEADAGKACVGCCEAAGVPAGEGEET
ncbi:MAG TPA: FAD-dependent oxidoreductase [Thiobacillus sp.]|nr:FAD-dependent oxidoreductase [Thiobacillus sp.]